MREPLPIVGQHSCLLSAEALTERMAEWRAVTAGALVRSRAPGSIALTLETGAEAELMRLIDAEAACCSFLRFDVSLGESGIDVELHYPPDFAPQVSSLIG